MNFILGLKCFDYDYKLIKSRFSLHVSLKITKIFTITHFRCRTEQASVSGDLPAVKQPVRDHLIGRRHRQAVGRPHWRVHPEPRGAGFRWVGRRRLAHSGLRHQADLRRRISQRD